MHFQEDKHDNNAHIKICWKSTSTGDASFLPKSDVFVCVMCLCPSRIVVIFVLSHTPIEISFPVRLEGKRGSFVMNVFDMMLSREWCLHMVQTSHKSAFLSQKIEK